MTDWKKAKNEYVTKGFTLEKIAKKYKTSISSVERHSAKESWVSARRRYEGKLAEKCMEKTAEKLAETFADYAVEMERDIIEIHRMLSRKIHETMTFDEPFSPRDLKSISSMLVDLMSNYERMIVDRDGDASGKVIVEFINNTWDTDED